GRISKRLQGGVGDLSFSPHFRYGFNNRLFNAWGELSLDRRSFNREGEEVSASRQGWTLAGGRGGAQYNPDNPISETVNALYTLLRGRNYMKIYESRFAELRSATRFDNGMRLNIKTLYEDRRPLENTTYYSFVKESSRAFTVNYPWEIPIAPQLIVPHQAL